MSTGSCLCECAYWLRAKCVQMYHNIFTVRKRLWGTITCSWISVLPRHASAFHTSHPTIWRMCRLSEGEKKLEHSSSFSSLLSCAVAACASRSDISSNLSQRTEPPSPHTFASTNMIFGTHTQALPISHTHTHTPQRVQKTNPLDLRRLSV